MTTTVHDFELDPERLPAPSFPAAGPAEPPPACLPAPATARALPPAQPDPCPSLDRASSALLDALSYVCPECSGVGCAACLDGSVYGPPSGWIFCPDCHGRAYLPVRNDEAPCDTSGEDERPCFTCHACGFLSVLPREHARCAFVDGLPVEPDPDSGSCDVCGGNDADLVLVRDPSEADDLVRALLACARELRAYCWGDCPCAVEDLRVAYRTAHAALHAAGWGDAL